MTSDNISVTLQLPGGQTTAKGAATDGTARLDVVVGVDNGFDIDHIALSLAAAGNGSLVWGDASVVSLKDTDLKGVEKEGKTYYTYTYVAPPTMPAEGGAASQSVVLSVEITGKTGTPLKCDVPVALIRPPVLMIHGLNSSAETFNPMKSALEQSGAFLDIALKAADYSATSLDSYKTNQTVVPDGILELKKRYVDAGYAVEKVSLIGHSMGGLLSRIYLQGDAYRGDIFQLICIDTPHSGSQLADLALDLSERYPASIFSIFGNLGAIVDLSVASDATASLNGASLNARKVPSHNITATIATADAVPELIGQKEYVVALLAFVAQRITGNLYQEPSDLVVPFSSQLARLSESTSSRFEDQWHCSVHTTQAAADRVLELLKSAPTTTWFCQEGFAPVELTYQTGSTVHLRVVEDDGVAVEIGKGKSKKVSITGAKFEKVDVSFAVLWDPNQKSIVDTYLGIVDPQSFYVKMPKGATGDLTLFVLGFDKDEKYFYSTSKVVRPI